MAERWDSLTYSHGALLETLMFDDWRSELDKADDERQRAKLNRAVIRRAVEDRRQAGTFHTRDIVSDRRVIEGHPRLAGQPRFQDWVDSFLRLEAPFWDLRGPLPGHPAWGNRWAFRSASSA